VKISQLLSSIRYEATEIQEFDFQWEKIPSPFTQYTEDRVKELLKFTKLPASFFRGKNCLDVGSGNGRYTYALQKLGAEKVDSFDVSEKAIKACKQVNPNAYVMDLMDLTPTFQYDFVLCWGVLHHLSNPYEGFRKVVSQVSFGGVLLIMVYNKATQGIYEEGRKTWSGLTYKEKIQLCKDMIKKHGGNLHGWWDAYNPRYNWSFSEGEVNDWFKKARFWDTKRTDKPQINMRGTRPTCTLYQTCSNFGWKCRFCASRYLTLTRGSIPTSRKNFYAMRT